MNTHLAFSPQDYLGDTGRYPLSGEASSELPAGNTLVEDCFDHYKASIFNNPSALAYLEQWGVDDTDVIKQLEIGFSDRTLGKFLPTARTFEGAVTRQLLQGIGLLTAYGGEQFRGALVFPIRNKAGNIVYAYGERICRWLRAESTYLPEWGSVAQCLYNSQLIEEYSDLILCQSPVEVAALMCAGIPNAVATLGLRSFSEEHLMELAASGVKRIYIAYENSAKGNKAARLVAQALACVGIECRRISLPRGLDTNTYLVTEGVDRFSALLNKARPCKQTYQAMKEDCLND